MTRRIALVMVCLIVVILIPFFLFEQSISKGIEGILKPTSSRALIALSMVALLGADIFLPVPSSILSTTAGGLFGFGLGATLSFIGMTLGCVIGYLVARCLGAKRVEAFIGKEAMERIHRTNLRYGDGSLLYFRGVPVLAEASVLFAGMSSVPFPRFLMLTSLANLALSLLYAAIGQAFLPKNWFIPLFLIVVSLPIVIRVFSTNTQRKQN